MYSKRFRFAATGVAIGLVCFSHAFAKKPPKPPDDDGIPPPALVYTTDGAVITVASADGEVIGKLTGGSRGYSIERIATWSPEGTQIAYIETTIPRNGDRTYDLYTMNVDGSGKTLIHQFTTALSFDHPDYHDLRWLPGLYLSYRDVHGLAILDMVLGTSQRIDFHLLYDWVGASSIAPGLDPTLPGSEGLIVYSALDIGISNSSDLYLAILSVETDGSLFFDPTTIRRLDMPGNQNFPVVSPDGLQVAFYDDATADAGSIVSVVDLDYSSGVDFGTVQTLLEGGLGEFRRFPTWSPDNQWIAFTWIIPGERNWEIARIRPDGTEFTNVTNSRKEEQTPDWIPVLPSE